MVDHGRGCEIDVAALLLVGNRDEVVVFLPEFHEALNPFEELFLGYIIAAGHHLHDVICRVHELGTRVALHSRLLQRIQKNLIHSHTHHLLEPFGHLGYWAAVSQVAIG